MLQSDPVANRELFGKPTTSDVSINAKITELERELKLRRHVYPRLIGKGRISKRTANEQYLILQAILEDYYAINRRGHP